MQHAVRVCGVLCVVDCVKCEEACVVCVSVLGVIQVNVQRWD